jgi:hypothetical protein
MAMGFYGKGKETYVYLNGIKPREKVCLDEGLFLVKSSCRPSPDDIISKCKNEIDIGVACVFLRSVSSHFHITAKTPKQLAVKAWNSQWDAVLLSALYECEIGHNFQSDVAPKDFSSASEFNVTNYAFKGLSSRKIKKITASEHKWIAENYSMAKKLMGNDRYCDAVHSLSSYRWHSMPRPQLALLWSGIEGLFGIDHELSFRLSLYIAKYLSPSRREKRKIIFNDMKKLYTIRSKAVHGGKIKEPHDSVKKSVKILRQLVMKCAEKGELPKIDDLAP